MTRIVKIQYDNGEEVMTEETDLTKLAGALDAMESIMLSERALRIAAEQEMHGWRKEAWRQEDETVKYKERFHTCILYAAGGWVCFAITMIVWRLCR